MNLTPYQRGNRDGLLSLAKELEHLAKHYNEMGDYYYLAYQIEALVKLAILRSEALPHDPEEEPNCLHDSRD